MKIKPYYAFLLIMSIGLASCQTTPTALLKYSPQYENIRTMQAKTSDLDGDSVLDDIDECPGTLADVVVDEKGCPAPVDLADTVTMDFRIFFDRGDYELQDKFLPQIDMLARKMYSDPKLIVFLSGYTSSKREAIQAATMTNKETDETRTYDQLGKKRAQRIKRALLEQGISADKIYTFDCADNIPVAPNNTEEGAIMNQRVYGRALPADDFFTGTGYGQSDSFDYYKSLC